MHAKPAYANRVYGHTATGDGDAVHGRHALAEDTERRALHLAGERLHRGVVQALPVLEDGERIAGEPAAAGEHIDDAIRVALHAASPARTDPNEPYDRAVDPTTQAFLAALIGAVVAGATVLAWAASDRQQHGRL
mgnify:CR=1 FL=1